MNKYKGSSILTQNSKMRKTSKEYGVRLFNFGIPAYKTMSGKMTCPFADACVKFCYAQKGAYAWSNVKPAFEKRYELTKEDDFVLRMVKAIESTKATHIRIHDSGDFYSKQYLFAWMTIATAMPDVTFYFYTKSVLIVKIHFEVHGQPDNVHPVFSYGGRQDELINKDVDAHSVIFDSKEELEAAGYTDCSKLDLNIIGTKKVGLIIH
jgi:hypothetical protein